MRLPLPENYQSLRPFRQLFGAGVPILMYHKIAPRPRRVRLKGLYVSPTTFVRQMAELTAAGFISCTPAEACHANGTLNRRITLTFDDGFRNVWQNALAPLAEHRLRALQFLVPNCIGKVNQWDLRDGETPEPLMDHAEVRDWLRAGHAIGSHSLTHSRLTRLSVRDAREEIFASKKKLEDTFGVAVEHFSYPYGEWNPTVRDLVIEAGYRTACSTAFGVNTPATSPFVLRRITVRHPTRTLRSLKARLLGIT
ncbi:MAG: polysaccharide deacetylase family protein [Verrucomicrobiota bacterium]|jgi:peptidoglycan/xylan/chitin deacetylase (PgdA/CDA1 family)